MAKHPSLLIVVGLLVLIPSVGIADEAPHHLSLTVAPINLGKFTFFDDGDQAYEPNLRTAIGLSTGFEKRILEHLTIGARFQYLHTMAPYDVGYSEYIQEGTRGYADLLRPSFTLGGRWSSRDENLDFTVTALLGPTFAMFEDLSMAGFHVAANGGAVFWLSRMVGLRTGITLFFDYLHTYKATGWASDNFEGSRATTLFFLADVGVEVRF